ncbi:MAG: alpha/beta hydrolase family protein, partial [Vicinamibacterales bacterium]
MSVLSRSLSALIVAACAQGVLGDHAAAAQAPPATEIKREDIFVSHVSTVPAIAGQSVGISVRHFLAFERNHKTLHNAFAEFLTKGTVNGRRGVMTVDRHGNDLPLHGARNALDLTADRCEPAGQTTSGPSHQTVRYSNDGLRLEAYLYRPAGPGSFPLVIHRHTGTEPARRWGAVIAQLLTDAGYAVLVPERRGTRNSEGQRFTEVGVDRDRIARLRAAFNTAEAGDVLSALEEVTRDRASRIDVRHIAIMGYSAGGSVAVLAAARSNRFRALITQAPSSVNWTLEAPLRDAVLAAARRVHVPTLCMVAENDNTTDSARSVCDAAKEGGAVANLIVYPSFTPREPSPNALVAPGHTLFNR